MFQCWIIQNEYQTENCKSAAKKNKKQINTGKRYTQFETDLLCDLVLASDINTMVTNKITPYGRMRGWEDITKTYNASENVTVSCICALFLSLSLSV